MSFTLQMQLYNVLIGAVFLLTYFLYFLDFP